MFRLANSFALGCLASGGGVAFLSCFLIGDAVAAFPFVWAGYGVVGCLSAIIYAPVMKVAAFGRREIAKADNSRAFLTAAICMVAEYLFAVAARTHQYDREVLFIAPLLAAMVDAVRARAVKQKALTEPAEELADTVSADR